MTISRRQFGLMLAGVGAAAAALPLASCSTGSGSGSGSGSSSGALSLWVWSGAIGDSVTKGAAKKFDGLKVSTVGGDFKQKLVTSFTAKSGLPSVTGVKGEDMPYFLQKADLFTDLSTIDGVSAYLKNFPKWKVAAATSSDGKVIGIPIDIGPTGLFYRTDILAKAGLPTSPAEVADATSTWDKYFAFGQKLKAATGADLEVNITDVFSMKIAQDGTGFASRSGKFIGDSDAVKAAWDLALQAKKLGISAGLQDGSPDWAAAVTKGQLPTVLGAAWHAGDIKSAAPDTSGKWNVTLTPGGSANIGGSFLTIPAGTKDQSAALALIKWLLNSANEATSYAETGNFPAFTPALSSSGMTAGDAFFGGQKTVEVFEESSKKMPTVYTSPFDSQVSAPFYTELTSVESQGKDADQAWSAAVAAAKTALASAS